MIRAAVVAFAVAALLALATNIPLPYGEPAKSTPQVLLKEWDRDATRSQRAVATAWGKVFAKAKTMNGIKAGLLTSAMGAQFVAVGLVAAAVWLVLD